MHCEGTEMTGNSVNVAGVLTFIVVPTACARVREVESSERDSTVTSEYASPKEMLGRETLRFSIIESSPGVTVLRISPQDIRSVDFVMVQSEWFRRRLPVDEGIEDLTCIRRRRCESDSKPVKSYEY